uniref:Putative vesicle-associated membrane protein 726 n=1 Tax=Rhizophora mucronata TaxID=61149 RepID=A0A2P2JY43_RHIMU
MESISSWTIACFFLLSATTFSLRCLYGGLNLQAQDFRQQGTQMRRKMWFQNMKIKLIVLGIIIALILIIILSVCRGFHC